MNRDKGVAIPREREKTSVMVVARGQILMSLSPARSAHFLSPRKEGDIKNV